MPRQPNARLAEVMRRTGCSNTSLASRVQAVAREQGAELKCMHVDVRRWLDGVMPRPATAQFIATLGVVVVPSAWSGPMLNWLLSRPEPIPVRNGGRVNVGDPDVQVVRMTAQMFMTMDFQFGGGHARAALAQYYVNDVCPLLEGRFTEQVGRRLFSAAAEVAQLLGWTAYDIGRHGLAQRYLIQALRLAQEADDRMMGGRLLSNMSHQAAYLGNFDLAVQLARAAQEGSRNAASATTMAMFLAMEARAHAGNGEDGACSRALREAERYFGKSDSADDPLWIRYFDAAELAGEGAHCFRDLRNPRTTHEFVTRAIELTDPVYVRTLAFVRLVHAASYVQQREPGQGRGSARGDRTGGQPEVAPVFAIHPGSAQ